MAMAAADTANPAVSQDDTLRLTVFMAPSTHALARLLLLVRGRGANVLDLRWRVPSAGREGIATLFIGLGNHVGDEQAALIPVGPPGIGQAAAYLIYPSSLLDALSALFESIWDGARRLVISPAGEIKLDGLSELDIRLLQLLATGATDSTIARVTGCSLRTVQRRIRVMMHQLGVRTRFQAGLEARSRHWI